MNISYSKIESSCNELHALAVNMKDILDNIQNIASKVSSENSWSGVAAENYSQKLRAVTKNFDEVFREMENSVLFLANCSEGYQAIDQNVMREICSNLNITEPSLGTSGIFNI